MNCPKCDKSNPKDARFCMNCGAPIALAGPRQEARLREMQESTPQTLQEKVFAEGPQIVGARKPVTILFTDIVGSTALAERLDPEEWREILEGAHRGVSEAVYHYEGTIAQLLGDGVLAFFGAPITHEDDPIRAVHAALNIQEAIRNYRIDLGDRVTDVQIRIGIHTGTVVVDAIGTDMHVEYLAVGDAVNFASRLESAAEPGSILISEEVLKRVSHIFATEAVGPLQLRGKRKKVKAYQVLGPLEKPRLGRGIEGMTSPLVGRDVEFKELEYILEQLEGGDGRIVTVVGEAGIGKSRLITELRHSDEESGFQWLEGRCLSYGGTMPYHLWLDLLQNHFNLQGDIAPEEARIILNERVLELCGDRFEAVYPYLGRVLNIPLEEKYESHVHTLTGQDLKRSTFKAMEIFIDGLAGNAPTVIVCEDLHWSDPTSLELLEKLHVQLADHALLFLSIFRPDITQDSWTYRERISDHHAECYTGIHLEPLSERSSSYLMKNLLGFEMMPAEFKARILRRSEGNPFFVEEILRSLVDSEVIIRDGETGEWVLQKAPDKIYIPDTLHGVLLARIDRLQVETKRVLQMASVIGRIFTYRVLDAISKEENNLDQRLTRLTEEEMIRERWQQLELEYIFKHHLTWETAYNALLKKDRKNYHLEVGEALERLYPDRIDEILGVLAYHWERAEDPDKAIDYLLRAGDQARETFANQEAINFFERAQYLLEDSHGEELAARVFMKLGMLYYANFEFDNSQNAFRQGSTIWQEVYEKSKSRFIASDLPAFRMRYGGYPTIDSTISSDPGSAGVITLLFSGLMSITSDMNVLPDVAREWEIQDDGRRIVFHLRDDAFWSDGTSLTASDFVFAWERILDSKGESDFAPYLFIFRNAREYYESGGKSIEAPGFYALDENTLVVEFEDPVPHIFYRLASPQLYPVPAHILEKYGNEWIDPNVIVSNGPYELQQWIPGETMSVVRRSSYKNPNNFDLGKIELILGQDCESSLAEFMDDEVDVFGWVHQSKLNRELAARDDFTSFPTIHFHYFTFNTEIHPFDDARVRQAFAHAIDKNDMANRLLLGLASPAHGGLIPPGLHGHSPEIGLRYQPGRAKKLMSDAGYPDGRGFPNVEAISLGRRHHDIGLETDYLHEKWRDSLGIEVAWTDLEGDDFGERLGSFPAIVHYGMMGMEPSHYDLFQGNLRDARWSTRDERYIKLLEDAIKVQDLELRIERFRKVDRYITAFAMIVPLVNYQYHMLIKPWVKRFPIVMDMPCWREIILEPH